MAAELPIPVFTNLNDLYANLGTSLSHAERWNHLTEEFHNRFGKKPQFIARAPGRVNLIGDHIDYALFGVCPAAIERDILIACAARDIPPSSPVDESHHKPGSVVAENLHHKYPREVFVPGSKPTQEDGDVHAWHLDIDTKELRWESYVKAGYYGVLNHYFPKNATSNDTAAHPTPIDMLVTGSVPAGSGLSSSAAMVVASTLAFLAINGKLEDAVSLNKMNKGDLVRMAMENERRVGVNSGGMDQAASVICTASSALYITFFPSLTATPTPLPEGAAFVCANSLVVSDKAVSAKWQYNLRVVETLASARILAKRLGLNIDAGGKKERITLREVAGRLAGEKLEEGGLDDAQLTMVVQRMIKEVEILKPNGDLSPGELGVTLEQMIEMTGLSAEEFKELYLVWEVEATHFQLYKRAKHVYEESLRVLQFRRSCLDSSRDSDSLIKELGIIMNESQTSSENLCENSCPEVNHLVRLAAESGAYGSRVTGAGWGGCTVSLVAEDQVENFISKIKNSYEPYKKLSEDALSEAIFATKPSTGACVYKFD